MKCHMDSEESPRWQPDHTQRITLPHPLAGTGFGHLGSMASIACVSPHTHLFICLFIHFTSKQGGGSGKKVGGGQGLFLS